MSIGIELTHYQGRTRDSNAYGQRTERSVSYAEPYSHLTGSEVGQIIDTIAIEVACHHGPTDKTRKTGTSKRSISIAQNYVTSPISPPLTTKSAIASRLK